MSTTNTISGQLERISTASVVIWNKAKDMQLSLPAGSYWDSITSSDQTIYGTSNKIATADSGAGEYYTSESDHGTFNFGLDASAAAIKAINVQNYLGQVGNSTGDYITSENYTLKSGSSVFIPAGYNITPFTINASAAGSGLDATTAEAKHLYRGKTAYSINSSGDATKILGTLSQVYMYNPDGAYNSAKLGGSYIRVNLNSAWEDKADLNLYPETISTNIRYRNTGSAGVTGNSTTNGSVGTLSSQVNLETYDVYGDTTAHGSNSASGKTAGKYLKVSLTPGYYDSPIYTSIAQNPTVNTSITVKKVNGQDGKVDTIANSLIVPAGYYTEQITITPTIYDLDGNVEDILNYTDLTVSSKLTVDDGDKTITFNPTDSAYNCDYFGKVTIPVAQYSHNDTDGTDTITEGGYIQAGKTFGTANGGHKLLDSSEITVSTTNSSGAVNTNKFTVTIPEDIFTSSSAVTATFSIQSGKHDSLALSTYDNNKFGGSTVISTTNINKQCFKVTDSISSAGWLDVTSDSKYYKIQDFTRGSTSSGSTGYYTVSAPGWIQAGSYVADKEVDLSKTYTGAYSSTGVFDPTLAELTIDAGSVLLKKLVVKQITAGTAKYTLQESDLTSNKVNITASMDEDGEVSSYMSSITVDNSIILEKLMSI